ncbi:MAG: hypothetical protein JO237_11255 [Pseudolabrys sp.]|nr:hypothetical protein [Pseudolabrys sp.]
MPGRKKISILCGALLALLAGLVPAAAQQPSLAERLGLVERRPHGQPFYVDFRAGQESITGHSWVTFGRIDSSGRVLGAQSADLYPADPDLGSYVGALAPVRGHVRVRPGEGRQPSVVSYRHYLTAAEYARMQAVIAREQRVEQQWSLWLLNCNNFAIAVAEAIGMRTPPPLMLPQTWVTTLRVLNGR